MISMTDCSGNIHSALSLGMSQYIILTPTSFPQTERTDAPFEVHTSLLANILQTVPYPLARGPYCN